MAAAVWADLPEHVAAIVFAHLQSPKRLPKHLSLAEPDGPTTGLARKEAARWTASCRAVCARWSKLAGDDSLWQSLCASDFGGGEAGPGAADAGGGEAAALAAKLDELGLRTANVGGGSGRGVWLHWHRLEQTLGGMRVSAGLYLRAAGAWACMASWSAENAPHVAASLCPPADGKKPCDLL